MIITDALTAAQEQRIDELEREVAQRVLADVRLGSDPQGMDLDAMLIDLLTDERDPAVAEALRRRFGIGVA